MASDRAILVAAVFVAAAACSPPASNPSDTSIDATVDGGADLADGEVGDPVNDAEADHDLGPTTDSGADVRDSGTTDAGTDVADATDDGRPCPIADVETFTELPELLSETGLYADIANRQLSAGVSEFAPRFPLWSDGAEKTRWVALPDCPPIDTSDPDHWEVPVGTSFWKQFVVDGLRIETRLIHRYGPGPDDYLFGAYVWNEEETEAVLTPAGLVDARGTSHDVPNNQACEGCHTRLPERILGFSAVQLGHDGEGLTLDDLANGRRLSHAIPPFDVPGDATAVAALGYLHGNCGNCHNDSADALQLRNTPLSLRVSVNDDQVADSGAMRTTVDVPVDRFSHPSCSLRVDPGSPMTSCLLLRMQLRGRIEQMPPIGTEQPDPDGVQLISDWIESLTP